MPTPFAAPDQDDDDETGTDGAPGADSKNFADLRRFANKRDREAKQYETELSSLREFKEGVEKEKRASVIEATFKEVGLNPKHADLFSKLNADAEVTVDIVKNFASEYELPTIAGQSVPPVDAPPAGFNPVTSGSPAPLAKLTMEDINKMLASGDTAAVQDAFKKGLVEKEVAPWSTGRPE